MSAIRTKVRIFDLAKDLRIDTKRFIEEVRREGVDVSVPSNSISRQLAEKIREKYFPRKDTSRKRVIKLKKLPGFPSDQGRVQLRAHSPTFRCELHRVRLVNRVISGGSGLSEPRTSSANYAASVVGQKKNLECISFEIM